MVDVTIRVIFIILSGLTILTQPYNVPDALNPEAPMNPQLFMNGG